MAGPCDIVALGEPLFELNATGEAGLYRSGFGGDTSNTAVAASRSGARVAYLTRIGTDTFGDAFMKLWAEEGIETSGIERDPRAPTGIYFITHGPDGHDFDYRRAGSAASLMEPASLPADMIAGARLLHVSAISQAISESATDTVFAAIEIARAAGALVAYDTNLRLKLWPLARARAVILATIGDCDIVLPGHDDAALLLGTKDPDAIVDAILAKGPGIVALTLGAEGVLVATPERRERIASHVVKAVDASGAGDTFDGAFLAEYLRGGDPFAAARYANAAAALSVQGYGAVEPMPDRAAVEAFLTSDRD